MTILRLSQISHGCHFMHLMKMREICFVILLNPTWTCNAQLGDVNDTQLGDVNDTQLEDVNNTQLGEV